MCCSDGDGEPGSGGGGGGGGGLRMTRCGLLCGMAALAALTGALLGPAWLHTEERIPHLPRPLSHLVSVRFKLGLFKACPKVIKPANVTLHFTVPGCSNIRYKTVDDVNATELGFERLELTPIVVTKMRISTPFQVAAAALLLAGTISALIGHCCSDHRTLVACGLFLLGDTVGEKESELGKKKLGWKKREKQALDSAQSFLSSSLLLVIWLVGWLARVRSSR